MRGLAVLLIIGIIEIGQAQHVAEFVAEGADSAHRIARCPPVFGGTGIGIGPHPVVPRGVPEQGPGVGPDGVGRTALGLIVAGIEEEDIVHHPVLVVVVDREVYLGINQATGLVQGLIRMRIAAIHVAAIIAPGFGQFDGTDNIVGRLEIPTGILDIIIPDRAGGAVGRIAFLVEQVREGLVGIADGKRQVGKLDQQDQEMVFPVGNAGCPLD